jgi:hypothetical protein
MDKRFRLLKYVTIHLVSFGFARFCIKTRRNTELNPPYLFVNH